MTGARHRGRLTIAWALVILAFAVVPTHALLESTVGDQETLATQVGHFVEFAVLAALAMSWATERAGPPSGEAGARRTPKGGLGDQRRARAAAVWAATVAYGALIEVLQMPLSYRSAQVEDLAVDAAGALAGLLAFSWVCALRGRGRPGRAR